MLEEIGKNIRKAAMRNEKVAMIHYQILIHADELTDIDAIVFCQKVGIQKSYKTEFCKMLKLAKLMDKLGMKISKA